MDCSLLSATVTLATARTVDTFYFYFPFTRLFPPPAAHFRGFQKSNGAAIGVFTHYYRYVLLRRAHRVPLRSSPRAFRTTCRGRFFPPRDRWRAQRTRSLYPRAVSVARRASAILSAGSRRVQLFWLRPSREPTARDVIDGTAA